MVRNAWHISGGQGWCANTTCRRVLVTHPDGHQTVEEITNDIDIDKNDHEAMMAKLKSRGIDAVSIAVTGGPPPKSGATTPEPSPSSRTSTARGRAYLQSSIQF